MTTYREELRARALARQRAAEAPQHDAHVVARRELLVERELAKVRLELGKRPVAAVATTPSPRTLETVDLPNPMLTDGLAEAIESGEVKLPATVPVAVNMRSLIGGFARVAGRSEAQTAAAARYRWLWERSRIGGARATDYGQVRVDTSGASQDLVLEIGETARRRYQEAVRLLGMRRSRLVELVVCEEMSIREVARLLTGSQTGEAGRRQLTRMLVESIDALVPLFGLDGRGPERAQLRAEVETPGIFTGIVATRARRCSCAA